MKMTYVVKQLGRKHPLLGTQSIEIALSPGEVPLRALLEAVVRQQVNACNDRNDAPTLIAAFSPEEVDARLPEGKVGFGARYNHTNADPDKAVATALQAFEDGVFAVFVDDEQIGDLDATAHLDEACLVAFVRLTFLAGSIW